MTIPSVSRPGSGLVLVLCLLLLGLPGSGWSSHQRTLRLGTTADTVGSGLLDVLIPEFEREAKARVAVVLKDTEGLLVDGREGYLDVLLTHAPDQERDFLAAGFGAYRIEVMSSDFVLVGPQRDPAGVSGGRSAARAFEKIALSESPFVSRGDVSPTHLREQEIWRLSGRPLEEASGFGTRNGRLTTLRFQHPRGLGTWFSSVGGTMSKTLLEAETRQAYTLADRGTFLKYKLGRSQGLKLEILLEGDPLLRNPYAVIPVNPVRHPAVNSDDGNRLARWLAGPRGQHLIRNYRFQGQPAFTPAFPAM